MTDQTPKPLDPRVFAEERAKILKRLEQHRIKLPPVQSITPSNLSTFYQLLEVLDDRDKEADEKEREAKRSRKRADRAETRATHWQERIERGSMPARDEDLNWLYDADETPRDANDQIKKLKDDNADLRRKLKIAEDNAGTDELTGLYNPRSFRRAIPNRIARMKEKDKTGPASVVFIDLNYLKPVNDAIAYSAGDAMLKRVGEILHNHTAPHGDIAGRIGGDEFGLLLYDQDATQAMETARRIQKEIRSSHVVCEVDNEQTGINEIFEIPLSVAVGVCEIDRNKEPSPDPRFEREIDLNVRKEKELQSLGAHFLNKASSRMKKDKDAIKAEGIDEQKLLESIPAEKRPALLKALAARKEPESPDESVTAPDNDNDPASPKAPEETPLQVIVRSRRTPKGSGGSKKGGHGRR